MQATRKRQRPEPRRVLEIRRMLCVSTGHLPEALMAALHEHAGVVAWPTPYGALMWVPDDPRESARADDPGPAPEILRLQNLARQHGCDYVILDCDGPEVAGLPLWDW
jgi:hypothetical protein